MFDVSPHLYDSGCVRTSVTPAVCASVYLRGGETIENGDLGRDGIVATLGDASIENLPAWRNWSAFPPPQWTISLSF